MINKYKLCLKALKKTKQALNEITKEIKLKQSKKLTTDETEGQPTNRE